MRLRRTSLGTVLVLFTFTLAAHGGVDYPDPDGGWDYTYGGDSAAFGSGGFTSLDGTWAHDEADRWDGSQPGVLSDPNVDPDGPSPGGAGVFTAGEATYLRIQDTGEPRDHGWNEDSGAGIFSNRRLYWGHNIAADAGNEGASGVLDGGITFSFRSRIATGDPLDDAYLEGAANPMPWPAGGKGYDLGGDARGMFGVEQTGSQTLGFALSLSTDTPDGIGGGLVMNNKTNPIDTSDATPESVNLLSFSDSELTDWHEFYITVQENDADTWEVSVWNDGSTTANVFLAQKAIEAEYDGETLMMGLASGSRYGAYDVDFFSYKLGAHPIPEPTSLALVICALGGLLMSSRRRFAA